LRGYRGTLFLKSSPRKKLIKLSSLKEPFFTKKSVLSDSLPKTAEASHEKPLVFNVIKRRVFEGLQGNFVPKKFP
jgi:hypothetical protein